MYLCSLMIPYFSMYDSTFFSQKSAFKIWYVLCNGTLLTFFPPKLPMLLQAWNFMTKANGLQKHKHSVFLTSC